MFAVPQTYEFRYYRLPASYEPRAGLPCDPYNQTERISLEIRYNLLPLPNPCVDVEEDRDAKTTICRGNPDALDGRDLCGRPSPDRTSRGQRLEGAWVRDRSRRLRKLRWIGRKHSRRAPETRRVHGRLAAAGDAEGVAGEAGVAHRRLPPMPVRTKRAIRTSPWRSHAAVARVAVAARC